MTEEMEHPFKVGDRLICVDPNRGIEEGSEYTVAKLYWGTDYNTSDGAVKAPMVRIEEVNYTGYFARRFVLSAPATPVVTTPWWEV